MVSSQVAELDAKDVCRLRRRTMRKTRVSDNLQRIHIGQSFADG